MGLFDSVRCHYPLPDLDDQDLEYQSKTTPAQSLDRYVITPDGRLLHEAYDTRLEETPAAPFGFYLHRENLRWEAVDFRGQLEIHTAVDLPDGRWRWCSYLLWFKGGRVADVQRGPSS
jgi:hypothetical protein